MEKQLEDMTGINQSLQSERRRWMLGDMADDQRAQQLVVQIDTLEKQLGMAKRAIQEYESNVPLLLKRALKAEALEIAETHKVPIGALLECESPAEMERMARALAQSKGQKPEK